MAVLLEDFAVSIANAAGMDVNDEGFKGFLEKGKGIELPDSFAGVIGTKLLTESQARTNPDIANHFYGRKDTDTKAAVAATLKEIGFNEEQERELFKNEGSVNSQEFIGLALKAVKAREEGLSKLSVDDRVESVRKENARTVEDLKKEVEAEKRAKAQVIAEYENKILFEQIGSSLAGKIKPTAEFQVKKAVIENIFELASLASAKLRRGASGAIELVDKDDETVTPKNSKGLALTFDEIANRSLSIFDAHATGGQKQIATPAGNLNQDGFGKKNPSQYGYTPPSFS